MRCPENRTLDICVAATLGRNYAALMLMLKTKNMELIPCIQTLAHLNALNRWPEYKEHFDVDDILLAQDERVYLLIDHMFATLADSFTSRVVHIGMDEAHLLGRGRYADLHGVEERFGIMARHLRRVCDIGEKYGFRFFDVVRYVFSAGHLAKTTTSRKRSVTK